MPDACPAPTHHLNQCCFLRSFRPCGKLQLKFLIKLQKLDKGIHVFLNQVNRTPFRCKYSYSMCKYSYDKDKKVTRCISDSMYLWNTKRVHFNINIRSTQIYPTITIRLWSDRIVFIMETLILIRRHLNTENVLRSSFERKSPLLVNYYTVLLDILKHLTVKLSYIFFYISQR